MTTEHFYAAMKDCAQAAAKVMENALRQGLQARSHASIAVSGGQTPMHVLPFLAEAGLDWGQVDVTLIDERWVDADHGDSNEGLARRALLQGQAQKAKFTPLKTSDETPDAGVVACAKQMAAVPFPLDVAYLGFGADGHIASLFPDHSGWHDGSAAQSGPCVAVPATETRQARMSLTPDALLNSRRIVIVFSGDEKRAVYEAARKPGAVSELPLRLVLNQSDVPVDVFGVVSDG